VTMVPVVVAERSGEVEDPLADLEVVAEEVVISPKRFRLGMAKTYQWNAAPLMIGGSRFPVNHSRLTGTYQPSKW
jgi:hypothetical protein